MSVFEPSKERMTYHTDLDYPAESSFLKLTQGRQIFLHPISRIFTQFIAKCLLDNTIGILYLNSNRKLPHYDGCLISIATKYWNASFYDTQPQIFPYPAREKGFLIKQ